MSKIHIYSQTEGLEVTDLTSVSRDKGKSIMMVSTSKSAVKSSGTKKNNKTAVKKKKMKAKGKAKKSSKAASKAEDKCYVCGKA